MSRTSRRSSPALDLVGLLRGLCRRATPAGSERIRADVRVEHVDDPDLPFRLVRAAGILGPSSIDRLLDACANLLAPSSLHLDLGDARIVDADTMQRLEAVLDRLERRGIAIRLVGLDPHHPVLHG